MSAPDPDQKQRADREKTFEALGDILGVEDTRIIGYAVAAIVTDLDNINVSHIHVVTNGNKTQAKDLLRDAAEHLEAAKPLD